MKTWNALAMLAIAAVTAGGLIACGKTTNSGTTASTPPASTCTQSWDGTLRDQYGRTCSNYANGANTCTNARYDVNTGRYLDLTTGQPVNCNSTGFNQNTIPYYGQYGNQQINGCQGWTQIYGAQYIPVDMGNGQLVCMNTAYLGQQNPGYDFNQYYYTQQPLYTCQGYDCYSGGGNYNGYQYQGCSSQFNFGYASSGFSVGGGICF